MLQYSKNRETLQDGQYETPIEEPSKQKLLLFGAGWLDLSQETSTPFIMTERKGLCEHCANPKVQQ